MNYVKYILIGLISVTFLGCAAANPYNCAWDGDVHCMKEAFNNGWGANGRKPDGTYPAATSPLVTAVVYNNYEVVQFLIKNGADVKSNRNYGKLDIDAWGGNSGKKYGILAIAIATGNKQTVEILIDNDVPFDTDYIGIHSNYLKNKALAQDLQKYAVKYYKESKIKKQQIKQNKEESIKNENVDALLGI